MILQNDYMEFPSKYITKKELTHFCVDSFFGITIFEIYVYFYYFKYDIIQYNNISYGGNFLEIFVILILVIAVILNFYEIKNLKDRNRDLEIRINMLLKDTGKEELSTLYVSNELRDKLLDLKNNGKFVEAVKLLRQSTTYDLIGAKDYIENLK